MIRKIAAFVIWGVIIAHQIWREVEAFTAFQADQPGAGVWAFFADRSPIYLLYILGSVGLVALVCWIESRLPKVDADNTEFHEKGIH